MLSKRQVSGLRCIEFLAHVENLDPVLASKAAYVMLICLPLVTMIAVEQIDLCSSWHMLARNTLRASSTLLSTSMGIGGPQVNVFSRCKATSSVPSMEGRHVTPKTFPWVCSRLQGRVIHMPQTRWSFNFGSPILILRKPFRIPGF